MTLRWLARLLHHSRPATPRGAPAVVPVPVGSAAVEAALAQRLTGPGSGPYSGTPFRRAPAAGAPVGATTADDVPSAAARHDHGIIDHSRHVSSIGRR